MYFLDLVSEWIDDHIPLTGILALFQREKIRLGWPFFVDVWVDLAFVVMVSESFSLKHSSYHSQMM